MRDTHDWPVRIGEAAEMLGTSQSALRFYEQQGLVDPLRTPGGTRAYDRHHVQRLAAVIALNEAGVPLEAIGEIMEARRDAGSGDESSREVSGRLHDYLYKVRLRRKELEELEGRLERALALVGQCGGCRNKPDSNHCPDCPVNRVRDDFPFVELFWE